VNRDCVVAERPAFPMAEEIDQVSQPFVVDRIGQGKPLSWNCGKRKGKD
jgi:hypothetical protein